MTPSFRYPHGPDDPHSPSHILEQFRRVHELRGTEREGVDRIFGEHDLGMVPWPLMSRSREVGDYDQDVVRRALLSPPAVAHVDPTELHATQNRITRAGVDFYMGNEYARTGQTFADRDNPGNRIPVVYAREDGQHLLLSGHHRATTSLLKGQELEARYVQGPWGKKRPGR